MKYIESDIIELKEILNESLEKEVVGFLNTLGGTIFIGIRDDGTICGVENVDKTILKISDRIINNISPSPIGLFTIKHFEEENKEIININIAGGLEKPYHLKKFGMTPNGCFIRIGTQTTPMIQNKINNMFSRRVINTLHNVVSPNQYLTFAQLKIYYQEKGFDVTNEYFLKNLDLYTDDNKYNYVAYLMADNNGTSIKVANYKDGKSYEILERNEYGRCCLIKSTYSVLEKLNVINVTTIRVGSYANRKEYRLVDKDSLREAVLNAILHNDYINGSYPVFEIYNDRMEITSSGGLPAGLTVDEFFKGRSLPRNKELMRIFSDMELCEQLGLGMKKIMKYYTRDAFEISEHFLCVKFKYNKEALSIVGGGEINGEINDEINGEIKLEKRILFLIKQKPFINRNDISKILNISTRTVDRTIKSLKKNGQIIGKTKNKNGEWIYK